MSYPKIFVLRHGETEWNAAGRFQGALNSPLTETGREQARQQAALLADIDLTGVDIRISPQLRAIETAVLALGPHVSHMRTDDRLREIEVGDWTGALKSELEMTPGAVTEDVPDGPLGIYAFAPRGEGFAALRARCAAFLEALSSPTLCVTHGITSRMLRSIAMGRPTATLGDLPGGQGVIHIVEDGAHHSLGT